MNLLLPKFNSFFMAGFECTYAKTEIRQRLDMLKATRHEQYCRADFRRLKKMGIVTVREGMAWHEIDQGNGTYNFSRFEQIMKIAKEEGIQIIWDLNHFDYPDYLDPFSTKFVRQFTEYTRHALATIRKYQKGTLYIAPVNEISFFAWIGADRGVWAPYKKGRNNGFAFKQQLVRCAIAAMDAMWKEDRQVRFIHIDPFMRRVAKPPALNSALNHVKDFNNVVRFEAWDMLCGKTFSELGGQPKYLDVVGLNYYFHNQEFVISKPGNALGFAAMDWMDTTRISFAEMIRTVYERYRKPIVITETGSEGELRGQWWQRLLAEVIEAKKSGLPVCGVCAYPTVDRPDSVNYLLRRSGLWDFADDDKECHRIPHQKSLKVIEAFIHKFVQR